ncbi:DUF3006 domain-containing protein [Rummeliibacillus suwonensis]|uniref:DUF3006 domain-containing protein n=1 Tax=Rummeliibacillus suwonensis TaxID=1306154 RepID=UPI001AAE9ED1|nr:DUF3006 domain-containing protein [Rummeliibacillus suwonensis]MBO2537760.1 DUF3006 domain-containing protein [Rummeliibacillus suwonensis]
MQKGIIDRFEGDFAIIEIGDHTIDIPKSKLPINVNVGDQVMIDGKTITLDPEGTKKLRAEIDALADDLFEE